MCPLSASRRLMAGGMLLTSASRPASLPPLRMPRDTSIDPISALRERNYLVFLLGSLVSNTGNQMRAVAVGWEVYHRTGEPLSLGIIGLVLALPVILLALPAGAAADRYSRRRHDHARASGAGAQRAGAGVGVATRVRRSPGRTCFCSCTGDFRALGWPAATAIVAGLVPAKVFPNAAMWRSVGFQIAATLGPLLGGLLLARYGAAMRVPARRRFERRAGRVH